MTEPQYRLSAADLADTGRWRLIIYIHPDGISAYLLSVADLEIPAGRLFDISWDHDRATLLANIENAVYDNPRVLEDYSADIIIQTDKVIWTPLSDDYSDAEDIFASLFHTDTGDIFIHESDSLAALFTIAPGLKGFLDRTFSGTRISSHLSLLAAACRPESDAGISLFADCRKDKADVFLFSGDKLLCGASHDISSPSDAAYIFFSLADVYEIKPSDIHLRVNASDDDMKIISNLTSGRMADVQSFPLPDVKADAPMPLAARFCAARGKKKPIA